jgi:hypothetical protein
MLLLAVALDASLAPNDYFEVEGNSTLKHAYFDGYLVAKAGASEECNFNPVTTSPTSNS